MQPFRNILVGVDLAPNEQVAGREALELAAHLARDSGRLTLLHATREDAYLAPSGSARLLVTREGLSERGRASLERAAADLRARRFEVILELPDARAAKALVHHAKEHDVVIVATRSQSDFEAEFDERRLGTVSLDLVRRCPAPVWAVKPGHAAVPKRIVAATDLSDDVGRTVVRRSAQLARQLGAELHVVHAPQLSWTKALLSDEASREAELDRLARDAEAWIRGELEGGEATVHTPRAQPHRAVIDVAKEVDAELVVMGTVARAGVAEKLVGNTAERILGKLDRSLLALKPHDFE
ncbi:MAG TPA: universal stress protein [Polyangiaceae bacterium]|nr:universal stress protein [Polyangiaceae bacterium]